MQGLSCKSAISCNSLFKIWLAWLLLAQLFSCSTKRLPEYLENPSRHKKYPLTGFITAVGVSQSNQKDAELQAKARIASQIKSSVKSASTSIISELRNSDKVVAKEEIISRIEAETEFDSAELIRFDYGSSIQYQDKYYVFAYLPKELLLQEYYKEYEQKEILFRRFYKLALEATEKTDFQLFTETHREIAALSPEMYKLFFKINALLYPAKYEKHFEVERCYFELIDINANWKGKTKLYLALSGDFNEKYKNLLSDRFSSMLKGFGLSLEPSLKCTKKERYSFLLRLNIKEDCEKNYMGFLCSISLEGDLKICDSGKELLHLDLSDPGTKGSDSRDRDRALLEAYNSIDFEHIQQTLKKKLAPFLPL